jgi:hypothetical protein
MNVKIYILSRDRPEYLCYAIDSALKQNIKNINYEVVVSDNSVGDSVYKMIARDYRFYPSLKYIKRNPPLRGEEHIRLVINEAEAEADFYTIFHDDDILMDSYVDHCMNILGDNHSFSAVACNSLLIDEFNKKMGVFAFKSSGENVLIQNKKEFFSRYLPSSGGSAPFSSYMYRRGNYDNNKVSFTSAGKFSDVVFISTKLDFGPIYWLRTPLICYRVHKKNDSGFEDIIARKKLVNFMISTGIERRSSRLIAYRFLYLRNRLNQKNKTTGFTRRLFLNIYLLKKINISILFNFPLQLYFLRIIKDRFMGKICGY